MRIVGTTSLAMFLISPINRTFASHNDSRMVYFIAGAIFLSLQCSASNTLSQSLHCLALFSLPSVWYKIPGKHFHIITDYNKLFWITLLHLEVTHNIPLKLWIPLSPWNHKTFHDRGKLDCLSMTVTSSLLLYLCKRPGDNPLSGVLQGAPLG